MRQKRVSYHLSPQAQTDLIRTKLLPINPPSSSFEQQAKIEPTHQQSTFYANLAEVPIRSRSNSRENSITSQKEVTRKLPQAFQNKAKSGDRARTFEETQIDLIGTGSALNSLFTSPLQTLSNAVTGLFSGFPSRATIRRQPVVQNAINTAWNASTADYNERFGWITWDRNTDTYAVPAVSVGTPYACTPPPKPVDPAPNAANQVFHVGEFHLHPPLDPGDPAMANPLNWPIGPSDTDEEAAQNDNSPGIVRDFDTIARTGGVTDYTYGPWTRTE